jgi:hypothetical protein
LTWTLLGPDGKPYASRRPGILGGHRGTRIYGRLDCRAALRAIARGGSGEVPRLEIAQEAECDAGPRGIDCAHEHSFLH